MKYNTAFKLKYFPAFNPMKIIWTSLPNGSLLLFIDKDKTEIREINVQIWDLKWNI